MLTKSGTVLLGLLGALALTSPWAVSFPASHAAEGADSKKAVPEIRLWTETGPKVERPYDPVKAKRLEDLAYKVFDPPFAIRCRNLDTKQIKARFGGLERGVQLKRRHRGDDHSVLSTPQIVGTWAYPGLSIEVSAEFDLDGITTRLGNIIIASPDYPLQHGLSIGAPLSHIVDLFGEPDPYEKRQTEKGREIYYCSRSRDLRLILDEQDRLTEITLRCGELCTR